MTYKELSEQIRLRRTFLCVGLDTDLKRVPKHLLSSATPLYDFNRAIVDATAPYCMAYKPNLAFYETYGVKGWEAFEQTVRYIRENYPQHFIIADAKRGDIGNTSAMYARAFFEDLSVDALTVAPYMGKDSVTPFLAYKNHWVVLLALTSNSGSADFQLTKSEQGDALYERVIQTSQTWADEEQMMYVVGATQGSKFAEIRRLAPRHFLLVPGVGAQGGSLHDVCHYGMNADCGLIVNSSRGIIYADDSPCFAQAAAAAAQSLQEEMARELDAFGI